jgi:tRNA CCA-adding enzyme
MKISSVKKQVLEKFTLSKKYESILDKKANEILKKLKSASPKDVKIGIGGSLAKKTLVEKPVQDIDIFVAFKDDTKDLEKIIKKAKLKARKIHGSRDYFKIEETLGKKPIIYEIIPVKQITKPEEVENVTDFSLKHVNYVKSNINKNKKLADEIKIAKTFCHANNCYGAESYIKGFSGYALEILVIYFKTFENFLKQIQKENIIDPEKQFKNKKQILTELNESKLISPIILVDPVYKYRNVCAGLSKETFEKQFLPKARQFLKNPSLNLFEEKSFNQKQFEKKANGKDKKFIEIKLETEKQEGDIAATKMKKFFDFIIQTLEEKQQKVTSKHFEYLHENQDTKTNGKTAKAYLIIKTKPEIERKGPPLNLEFAVKKFKQANKKTYKKQGHLYTKNKIDLKEIFNKIKEFEQDMDVALEVSS